jgi:hypothetical protein
VDANSTGGQGSRRAAAPSDDNEFLITTIINQAYLFYHFIFPTVGRDSSVGTATRYGLDGPGIESLWGEVFCTRPDQRRGPPSLQHNGYGVSFSGAKRPGRGVNHPTLSSSEVKERVELYLYGWASMACFRTQ